MKKIKKILAVSIIGLLALILIATIVIGINLDNVNGTPDTNGPVRPGTNKPAKKLEVDDFLLAGAKVHVQLTGFANKELDLTLPDIHLVDLGEGNGGVTVVELTQKVLREVIHSTVKAVGKAAGNLSGKTVGK